VPAAKRKAIAIAVAFCFGGRNPKGM
jgi:PBSX family phage terminase large subunit